MAVGDPGTPLLPPTLSEGRWDLAALRAGSGVCIVFAVPLQIGAQLVGKDSSWSLPLRVGSLIGFVLGAGVAAWVQQRRLPLIHGMVTAIAAYAVVAVGFLVARGLTGHELRMFAALFNLTPVIGAGLFGGLLGQVLQRQGIRPSSQSPSSQSPSSQSGRGPT